MKQLFATSYQLIERTSTEFVRYLYNEIRWGNRLIAITGARGSGKTTLMLQYIKEHYTAYSNEALYASLDNIWFSGTRCLSWQMNSTKWVARHCFWMKCINIRRGL